LIFILYYDTSKPQNNFLYFKKGGFGVSGVWKDVSDFSLADQIAMAMNH